MPITFLPPQVPTIVGPGTSFFVSSDFIGPIPLDYDWIVTIYTEVSGPENAAAYWAAAADGSHTAVIENYQGQFSAIEGVNIQQGEACTMLVQLRDQAQNVIDESDRLPMTWDGSGALARWIQHQRTSTSGGLTPEEHDAVIQTNDLSLAINAATTTTMTLGGQAVSLPIGQVLASNLLDALTIDDLSGGPTCNPIKLDLSLSTLYGIVLVITAVPDETLFRTPDQGYVFPDLAVINIIRGGHILTRHGIHSLSHTIYPLPGLPFPWLTSLGAPLQPPDYHVNVDFAVGVCGQLLGLRAP